MVIGEPEGVRATKELRHASRMRGPHTPTPDKGGPPLPEREGRAVRLGTASLSMSPLA